MFVDMSYMMNINAHLINSYRFVACFAGTLPCIAIVMLVNALCINITFAGIQDDVNLKELEAAFSEKDTQWDMNVKSSKVRQYLDELLVKTESLVLSKVRAKDQEAFTHSCEAWRHYREDYVKVYIGDYDGGSIQPFIFNDTWSRLTKQKIIELEILLEDRADH